MGRSQRHDAPDACAPIEVLRRVRRDEPSHRVTDDVHCAAAPLRSDALDALRRALRERLDSFEPRTEAQSYDLAPGGRAEMALEREEAAAPAGEAVQQDDGARERWSRTRRRRRSL